MPNMFAKLTMEFTGTYFLCLTVALSAALSALAPLAIGGVLMCFIYAGAHVSGANYNPAVSVALALRGALPWGDCAAYVGVQLVASVAAGATAIVIFMNDVGMEEGDGGVGSKVIGHPAPDLKRYTLVSALLVEVIFTFALCFVVLNVATTKANAGNQFFGLAIGLTVTAGACAGGSISGGAFNPAVGFGLPLCAGFLAKGDGPSPLNGVPLYVAGPLLGAALAAGAFRITNPEEFTAYEKVKVKDSPASGV